MHRTASVHLCCNTPPQQAFDLLASAVSHQLSALPRLFLAQCNNVLWRQRGCTVAHWAMGCCSWQQAK